MTNTSLKLLSPLPESVVSLLAAVSVATKRLGIEYFVIGATARDIILNHLFDVGIQRATRDIDFGVAVESWFQFEELKRFLVEEFDLTLDQNNEHRLYSKDHPVDFVPFGKIAGDSQQIVFPKSEFRMTISGFGELFGQSLEIGIPEQLTVKVASLASIVVLKFIALNDRPHERSDDLADILFIARQYLDAGNMHRLYDVDYDVLNDNSFDLRTAGARLLGRDIAGISSKETLEIVLRQLTDLDRFADHDSMTLNEISNGIAERI